MELAAIGAIMALVTGSAAGVSYIFSMRKDIASSIRENNKKIDVIANGVLAIFKIHNNGNTGDSRLRLDAERFEEALEQNGITADDFIEDNQSK